MKWNGNLIFGGILACCLISGQFATAASDSAETFFETRVRPVLIARCFECHGQSQPKGGLRIDSPEGLLRGGDSGAAIVPGKANESLLIKAIRHDDESLQMPPKSKLSDQVVQDFTRWINEGAAWPAFEKKATRKPSSHQQFAIRNPNDPVFQPHLQVWIKADTSGWKDGQRITLWEDSSGRGHDLVATAGARQNGTGEPARFVSRSSINGFPAVHFDRTTGLGGNSSTSPSIDGDGEFALFLVARLQIQAESHVGLLAGFGEPASASNPGRARCAVIGFESGNTPRPLLVGGWGHDAKPTFASANSSPMDVPQILVLTRRKGAFASSACFSLNGEEIGSLIGDDVVPDFARRPDLGFFLGHAQNWAQGFDGDLAEVILYNSALGNDERHSLEAHLSAKYRIPLASTKPRSIAEEGDPAFRPLHWAFEPMKQLPASNAKATEESQIDRLIAAKWQEKDLTPVQLADSRTLIRRLYFDLIGLPPTNIQMQQALESLTPWNDIAWAHLVDQLLDSPHYGERWGRHWLDVVRYADTAGDNADYPVPEAALYRNYVIDSFNHDKPYNQFISEQLAGDLLAAESPGEHYAEQIVATGFLALSRRYATAPYELWHLTLEDTIDTVGQAFMGLTFRCARCHDHKFDPISQNDYYALYGIFESTQFPWAGGEEFQSKRFPREHFVPLIPPKNVEPLLAAQRQEEQHLSEQIAQWEKDEPLSKTLQELAGQIASLKAIPGSTAELAEKQKQHDKIKKEFDAKKGDKMAPLEAARRRGFPETIPIAYAVKDGMPRSSYLQRSGEPGSPGPVIARGTPTFLTSIDAVSIPDGTSGRRQLATWLTNPDHPLTSRVMVNRIWQSHFGQGLVATSNNFGIRGADPTHPELLDWLATTFVDRGWSVKTIHRLILTSKAWRLASSTDPENAAKDPANIWLWRHNRRRLEAEAIRDSILAANQRLDLSRPGTHPFPEITRWKYTQHSQFKDFYPSNHRSVYLMTSRLQRHPFLSLFDGPDTNTTTGSRTSSIVSAQSLYLMNSEEINREASAFADLVLKANTEHRITTAYSMAFQRLPAPDELQRIASFISEYAQQTDEQKAWTAACRTLLTSHEFFYVD